MASAGHRPARPRRIGRRTSSSTSTSSRNRPCSTGSAVIAIRCIPIPNSPLRQGFHGGREGQRHLARDHVGQGQAAALVGDVDHLRASHAPEHFAGQVRRGTDAGGGKGERAGLDLNYERAVLAKLQQEKLQLEISELRGDLVRASAVEARWLDMLAAIRAKLLALPSKLAVAIASPDRIQVAQDRAQALIHEALSELAAGHAA